MRRFESGCVVYVAHPYGGSPKNKLLAEEIIKKLFRDYPEVTFISPIHAIVCPYCSVSFEVGMDYCFSILKRCDCLLLTGDWQHSRGCVFEKEFADTHNIPVKILEVEDDT